VSDTNRSERARMHAGLSVGQAAKFLKMDRDDLIRSEKAETLDDDLVPKLCDVYYVWSEWIKGEVPQHDYESIDKMVVCSRNVDVGEPLTSHDRDILAEFAASMPHNTKTSEKK